MPKPQRKRCLGPCGLEKSVDEFYWDRGRPRPVCKVCYNEQQIGWRVASKDKRARWQRNYDLAKKYGITLEDYEAMLAAQDGVCAICQQPETVNGRTGEVRLLSVDHDHETEEVRGLLCHMCNSLLALAQEDAEILKAARDYVMRVAKIHAEAAA